MANHAFKRTFMYTAMWGIIAACAACAAAVFFAHMVTNTVAQRSNLADDAVRQSNTLAKAAHTRAMAAALATSSDQLEGLVHTDVFSLAQTISRIGNLTRSMVKIQSVEPTDIFISSANIQPPPDLHALVFRVGIDGSYGSVMRALTLLEQLPLPSEIQNVDIGPITAGDATARSHIPSTWHMDVRMVILTTAQISS